MGIFILLLKITLQFNWPNLIMDFIHARIICIQLHIFW